MKLFILMRDLFDGRRVTPTKAWQHFFVEEQRARKTCGNLVAPVKVTLRDLLDALTDRYHIGVVLCVLLACGYGPIYLSREGDCAVVKIELSGHLVGGHAGAFGG